tara:strand:+ start:47 stop:760 length:714 start_codon:yes stop_codon:yes gene_type:complete
MKTPLIGITADIESEEKYNSKYPNYTLRKNYCQAVENSGGIPVILPNIKKNIEHFVESIDGLLISGGNFDVNPSYFGEEILSDKVDLNPNRTKFEMEIFNLFIKQNKPVLGICGGQQLMHVALGGKLIQHIPDSVKNSLNHEQTNPRDEPSHTVEIKKGTLLYEIIGKEKISVNSAHHQAAKEPSEHISVNAVAPDGVIEGIESQQYNFCLGIQWHPEYKTNEGDIKIFSAFINASR